MTPAAQAVLFDFDGVIVESGPIKTAAFRELFADRPEIQEAVVAHHRRHLGLSRYRKFEWIYRNLLGRELTPGEAQRLGREFSRLVLDRVLACPLVPGARELLERLSGSIPAFVVSGTPQEELDLIVDRRSLRPLFTEVHGSPPEKPEIVAGIVERHGLDRRRVWLVGDGLSDQAAAAEAGVRFVAREAPGEPAPAWRQPVTRIGDLAELASRWQGSVLPAGR
ncbi:MAG: HAD hydrolase-like protein [Thermoanaerobaculia bacterium]|nr:HAD hydrolase-like protein [Thermoanaerobaculia bacterium]